MKAKAIRRQYPARVPMPPRIPFLHGMKQMQNDGNRPSRWAAIAREASELPGIRILARPIHRRLFRRAFRDGNDYYGVYASFEEAQATATELSTRHLPATYDTESAGRMYRHSLQHVRVSDYPLLYWLAQLFPAGVRRVFDLGGHIGVSYYGFRRYLDYPDDLHWCVHDMPMVMAAGRKWAREHDAGNHLQFADVRTDANGYDLLLSTGALQYFDYTLPKLLAGLRQRPAHVLVNLTPMHDSRNYFTVQNLGIAICPYRVSAVPDFVSEMEKIGYEVVDQWKSLERSLRIPLEPEHGVDAYHGFYFRLRSLQDIPTP
jgi:putative methyltransferase (TIGR04325 family)